MKIALMTPLDEFSTLGWYARLFLPALRESHDVEVWRPPPAGTARRDGSRRTLGDGRLGRYDLIVYQMSNDATVQDWTLEIAAHLPGVHLMHDYVMHNTIEHHLLKRLRRPLDYIRLLEDSYGGAGRRLGEAVVGSGSNWISETTDAAEFPLFEAVLEKSRGVVVHSSFYLRAVRQVFSGPATMIPLAVPPAPAEPPVSRRELGVPQDRILMVSTGYTNRPKLNHEVIQAMGLNRNLANQALFAIVGADCPVETPKLKAMARAYGIENSVLFPGFQTWERMHAWIQNADFCINLRRPNTEGASCSLIEQMRHGKAVVVIRTGFYAEVPEEAVAVWDGTDVSSLADLLLRLAADTDWRGRIGAAAREYACCRHTGAEYGRKLAGFLEEAAVRG